MIRRTECANENGSATAVDGTTTEIDRQKRKGKKPSDHAPVIAVFNE